MALTLTLCTLNPKPINQKSWSRRSKRQAWRAGPGEVAQAGPDLGRGGAASRMIRFTQILHPARILDKLQSWRGERVFPGQFRFTICSPRDYFLLLLANRQGLPCDAGSPTTSSAPRSFLFLLHSWHRILATSDRQKGIPGLPWRMQTWRASFSISFLRLPTR